MEPSAVRPGVGERDPDQKRIVEDDHALDQVLQLADVAGITMAREALHDRHGNGEPVTTVELRVALDEVAGQERDLGGALAQGRDQDVDDDLTVVEILTEYS